MSIEYHGLRESDHHSYYWRSVRALSQLHCSISINLNIANGGIGFELSNQLLNDAKNLVLVGSRSLEKGEAAVKELKSRNLPGSVDLVQIDVDNDDSIFAAAKEVERKYGR